jgi:carboxymethylenebutenolidase
MGAADAGGRPTMAWTGVLSEEEFKALHELRKDQAPPPRGTAVEIAGSTCYLSLPEGGAAPVPGIIVIHEWWGLNDHVRHWADRLAADGYAALAVDLYGGRVADNPDSAMAYVKAVDEARSMQILKAAHRFLLTDPRISAPRTGVIGWCFGGGFSLALAMAEPGLDAAVVYYGRLVTDPERLKAIQAPVLGIFGNRDTSIPPDVVKAFAAGLKKAGVRHDILRYDADHAFANPSGAHYDEQSAAAAWERARMFLRKNLKKG